MNTLATKSFLIAIFIIFCLTLSQSKSPIPNKPKPCNQFLLYYHDILYNGANSKNATSAPITNILRLSPDYRFGKIVVFNDRVTRDSHLLWTPVAQAQGFFFFNGKSYYNAWFAFTLVFNSTQHKGTLTIMGADIVAQEYRDFSVVGGTGDFFMAKGICTITTDDFGDDVYFRLKMDIKLYECY